MTIDETDMNEVINAFDDDLFICGFERDWTDGKFEAIRRILISKFYYTVLMEAFYFYDMERVETDFHTYVISNVPPEFQHKLSKMRSLRVKADYYWQKHVEYSDLDDQQEYYKRVYNKFK